MADFSRVLKYNPYHDSTGRFTSAGGAGAAAPAMLAAMRASRANRDNTASTSQTRSAAAGNFGRAAPAVLKVLTRAGIPDADHGAIIRAYSYPVGHAERAVLDTLVGTSRSHIDSVVASSGLTKHGMAMRGDAESRAARAPAAPVSAPVAATPAPAPVATPDTSRGELAPTDAQNIAQAGVRARTLAQEAARSELGQNAAMAAANAARLHATGTTAATGMAAMHHMKSPNSEAAANHIAAEYARNPAAGRAALAAAFAGGILKPEGIAAVHAVGLRAAEAHVESRRIQAVSDTNAAAILQRGDAAETAARETARTALVSAPTRPVAPAPATTATTSTTAQQHLDLAMAASNRANQSTLALQGHFTGLTRDLRSEILNGAMAEPGSGARAAGDSAMRAAGLHNNPEAATLYQEAISHAAATRQALDRGNAANNAAMAADRAAAPAPAVTEASRVAADEASTPVQSVAPAATATPTPRGTRGAAARLAERTAAATAAGDAAHAASLQGRGAQIVQQNQTATMAVAAERRNLMAELQNQGVDRVGASTIADAYVRSNINGQAPNQGSGALAQHAPTLAGGEAHRIGLRLNNAAAEVHSTTQALDQAQRAAVAATEAHMAESVAPGRGRPAKWANPGSPQPKGAQLAKIMADPAKRVKLIERHYKELDAMGISTGSNGETPAERAAAFDRLTGGKTTPHEVLHAFTGDASSHMRERGDSLKIEIDRSSIRIRGEGVKVHGSTVESISRDINFSSKRAYHGFLRFPEYQRDTGAGRRLFQQSIPLYEKLGMKSVGVSPALEAGAYVWTRFGFTSTEPQRNLQKLSGYVKDGISNLRSSRSHDSRVSGALPFNKNEEREAKMYTDLIASHRAKPDSEAQYFPRQMTNLQPHHMALRFSKSLPPGPGTKDLLPAAMNMPHGPARDAAIRHAEGLPNQRHGPDHYTQTKLTVGGKSMGYVQTSKLDKVKASILKKDPSAQIVPGKVKGFGKALVQTWMYRGSWDGSGEGSGNGIIRFNDVENMKHVRKYAGIRAPRAPRARRTAGNSRSTVTAAIAAAGPVIQPIAPGSRYGTS